jgi:hypothetical protein
MFGFAALLLSALTGAPPAEVRAAAARVDAQAAWQENSVLSGDFACDGKPRHAILGNKGQALMVAVFRDDLGQAPELLAFRAAGASARLAADLPSASTHPAAPASCPGLRLDGGAGRRIGQIVWNGQAFQSRSE